MLELIYVYREMLKLFGVRLSLMLIMRQNSPIRVQKNLVAPDRTVMLMVGSVSTLFITLHIYFVVDADVKTHYGKRR